MCHDILCIQEITALYVIIAICALKLCHATAYQYGTLFVNMYNIYWTRVWLWTSSLTVVWKQQYNCVR